MSTKNPLQFSVFDFSAAELCRRLLNSRDPRQTGYDHRELTDAEGALWDWFQENVDSIRELMEEKGL